MRWSTVTSLNKQTNVVRRKGSNRRFIFLHIQELYFIEVSKAALNLMSAFVRFGVC